MNGDNQREGGESLSPDASQQDLNIPQFITDAIKEIDRLKKFGRMVDLGFTLGKDLSTITNLYHDRLKDVPAAEDGLQTLRSLTEELQPYARAELNDDLAYLKALLTIRYVTILETVVQDAILFSLEYVPSVRERDQIRQIKGPVVELLSASASERAEFLAAALAQETRAALKPGAGKYEALLNAVGLGGHIEPPASRALLELSQVRNVLIHKNARVDSRFCKQCPWLQLRPGDQIRVSSEMTQRYGAAVIYYLVQILLRWISRQGLAVDTSAVEVVASNALVTLYPTEKTAG